MTVLQIVGIVVGLILAGGALPILVLSMENDDRRQGWLLFTGGIVLVIVSAAPFLADLFPGGVS